MIRYANINELNMLNKFDKHINKGILQELIEQKRILVMYENNIFVGWLRYNLFWDDIPFMNMLYLLEEKRGKGYGTQLIEFWENEMRSKGYKIVLTSTQANEKAQVFYRKNGYKDCGSLILPNEVLEIILMKEI